MAKIKGGKGLHSYHTRTSGRSASVHKNFVISIDNGVLRQARRPEKGYRTSIKGRKGRLSFKTGKQYECLTSEYIEHNNNNKIKCSSLFVQSKESTENKTNESVGFSQIVSNCSSHPRYQTQPNPTGTYGCTNESPGCMSFDENWGNELKYLVNNEDHDKMSQENMDTETYINTYTDTHTNRSITDNHVYNQHPNYSFLSLANRPTCDKSDLNSSKQNCGSEDLTDCCQPGRRGYRFGNLSDFSQSFPPTQARRMAATPDRPFKSVPSLSNDSDIDTDTIYPIKVENKTCAKSTIPPGVPTEFGRLNEYKKKLRNSVFPWSWGKICNEALIDHPHKTDTPLGDRFGASVLTDPSSGKDGYFRHFFVKVQQASPAYGMHVRNDDEIVLINDRFVPELNHEAIMTLISRVPVDGVTRFKLVLRRLISPPDGKNWIWFETSAVLVPELPEEPRPRATEVRRVPLNNMWDKTTFQRYKVIGTLNYLGICKNGVIMGVLTGDPKTDNSKTICKHAKVCEDPNDRSKFRFVTSLASADKVYYAALNENTNSAFTTKTEVFFDYRKIGSEICFQQNKVYLSCFNNQVCASSQRHMFEEFPTSGHKDVYDRSSYTEHDIGMDDVDGANTSLRGTTKAGKSSPYGTESSANAFLYGANTTQCSTRNGGNTPSCGIPLYMRTAGKMDNPRDSGYGTSSPGDTPPRKIMTRSLSKQLSMTSGLEALSFNDKLSVD